jgi:hypothetical protein
MAQAGNFSYPREKGHAAQDPKTPKKGKGGEGNEVEEVQVGDQR